MNEYRELAKIKFNNQFYQVYLDQNNRRFFLKIDAFGNLCYVTLEEYIELLKCFSSIKYSMNIERGNKKKDDKRIKLVPKIIVKGVLVPISTALLALILKSNLLDDKLYKPDFVNSISVSPEEKDNGIEYYSIYNDDKENERNIDDYVDRRGRDDKPTSTPNTSPYYDDYVTLEDIRNNFYNKDKNKDETNTDDYEYDIEPTITPTATPTPTPLAKPTPITEDNNYTNNYIDNNIKKVDNLEIDTYLESERLGYVFVYDMDYLDKCFGDYKKVTFDDIKSVINSNNRIPKKYKDLLIEYTNLLNKKYPNVELKVFYENLKTLEVVECETEYELSIAALSTEASGCYVKDENKIYVMKDNKYEKGTWDYQVIMHEFGHCLRNYLYDNGNTRKKVTGMGLNYYTVILDEALNSVFTVNIFDYEEKDIAYQLQSNYIKVMTDSMDNYDLSDYVNHSSSYFIKKLDEFNNDENYAVTILEMIKLQYEDFHDDRITVRQSEYYPIYSYISNTYYKNKIKEGMSYSDAKKVADELVSKVLYDVPEEYNIDVDYFYNYFEEYCKSKGITKALTK